MSHPQLMQVIKKTKKTNRIHQKSTARLTEWNFIKEFQEFMNEAIDQLLKKPVRRHSHQKDKPELHMEQGKHKEAICKEAEMLPPRNISRESDDK